jgi:TolB-like protein/Tfp pilus assembly protein PilF
MQQRRLAAIMFTDIVGYTSMMGRDEKKAFDSLRKNRRIQWRLIKKFRGRWLKEMGDGILASFSSNVDAVMCAISIQKAAVEMEIPLRIGIHQGDVIFEKKDVLGDGVNIASRIQGLADKNGIVISQTVYSDIKNKEGLETSKLDSQHLKGVAEPVGLYKVACQDADILDFKIDTGELIRPLGLGRVTIGLGVLFIAMIVFAAFYFIPKIIKPPVGLGNSIVVLPFDNYIGSDTLEYFVAGMHSSLIGEIGKISALQVKSKTTANAYKDVDKSIPEIAAELGVNILVEGSVLCLNDSVCLQIKLVSAYPEEQTLWVQDYKEEKSQILNLYNKVTKEISNEINVILTPKEEQMLTEYRTVNNDAYDAFLKANYYWDQFSPESIQMAQEYFNKAIEIDPHWGPPYAGMAYYWQAIRQGGLAPDSVAISNIYEYLNMANKLDPNSLYTQYVGALVGLWTEWDWEKGEEQLLNVLEINPNHAFSRLWYAALLMILKKDEEAIVQADLALELDPFNPMIQSVYAHVAVNRGEYEKAIEMAEKVLSVAPGNGVALGAMADAHIYKGDHRTALGYWLDEFQLDEKTRQIVMNAYDEKGFKTAAQVLAEETEKSVYNMPTRVAMIYASAGKHSKAMDLYEQAYKDHNADLPFIGKSMFLSGPYKIDDPRFFELLKKLNLPLE